MDNTDEIFSMNKQIYTKLASYNNKYHLFTSNCKDRISNTCKDEGDILDFEYQALEHDMNKLLELLNNNKIISGTNNDIDIVKRIEENNQLRAKLQTELDNLYLDKNQIIRHDDSEIESGLLWIFLTTFCIYFILVKL
jgi:ATP-dependent Lon protease